MNFITERYYTYRLLEPDGHLHTLAFGVTKRAVLPNIPGVCGRNTFHSEQRCTKQLCQQAGDTPLFFMAVCLHKETALVEKMLDLI